MINKDLVKFLKNTGPSVYSIRSHYPDLHLFKQQIDVHAAHHRPYTIHKQKVSTYRTIFMALALFYLFCGAILFYKLSPYTTGFLLGSYSYLIKNGACAFCSIAALCSMGIGFYLNAEREAAHFSYKKARRKLKEIYHHNLSKMGLKRFLSFGEGQLKLLNFKQSYHDSLDKLLNYKHEALILIDRIIHSESIDLPKRELLLNHSLLEMEDKMKDVILRFKSPDNLKLIY